MLYGIRIFQSLEMVERRLHAKSPSRARRRMKRGFPQHYAWLPRREAFHMPDGSLVMHPVMYAKLKARLEEGAGA